MSTWNWNAQRRTSIGDVANQPIEYVAERLLESRKRAFDAEQKAQQLQDELDALKAAHTWIKTSERMPEPGVKVLVLCTDSSIKGEARIAKHYRNDDGTIEWSDDSFDSAYSDIESKYVVAWMPRPEGEL
jgi:hypothetical protein